MSRRTKTLIRGSAISSLLLLGPFAGSSAAQFGGGGTGGGSQGNNGGYKATHIMPSQSQGIFSALSFGVVTTKSTGAPGDLLIGGAGLATEAPGLWSTSRFGDPAPYHPEYTAAAMFGSLAPVIEFAAISTGNDFIPPVLQGGQLDFVSILRWFALTVSVSNDAVGEPGTHIKRLINAGDTPGAELFTYYFSKSFGLPPAMINTVQSERSREQQGFDSSVLPGAPGVDVNGLDWGLGVIPHDPNGRALNLFSQRDRFYFALTADSVAALGGQPFAEGQPANTETIYLVEWEQQPPGSQASHAWGAPRIEYSPHELGLQGGLLHELDAISVDNPHQRLIFSTRLIPGESRNQLYVSQRSGYQNSAGQWIGQGAVSPKPLRDGNGVLVTEQVGALENDDVNGTCGVDPEYLPAGGSGGIGLPLDTAVVDVEVDTPLGPLVEDQVDAPLGLSVTRIMVPEGDRVLISTTGLEGGEESHGGELLLFCKPLDSGYGYPSPWLLLGQSSVLPGQTSLTTILPGPSELGAEVALQAVFLPYSFGAWSGAMAPSPRMSWVSSLSF